MKDQASALRHAPVRTGRAPAHEDAHALVIGGGKGGAGVSVLAALFAAAFAHAGRRVLLMDAALNQGNQHLLLGRPPGATLRTLLAGEASPEELVIPVAERLWLLPAESGAEVVHALTPMDRARLHVRLATLMDDYDVTVVDAGTGIDGVLRAALARSSRLVAVTTPEPAALADTYALVKILSLEAPALPVDLFVNRSRNDAEAAAAHQRLSEATHRFLGRPLGWLGALHEEERVRRAVRGERPLLELHGRVADAAARMLALLESLPAGGRCSS